MGVATDKLIKHGRFAHSGVYDYAKKEIPRLGLPWPPPPEIGEKPMYAVYRPAPVLVSAVKDGLFTRMTVTRHHPDEWVDPSNWKKHAVGLTGDRAEIEFIRDEGEVSVNGTLTLADEVALEAYDRGVLDLSPGYSASFAWKRGTHKGKSYDAIMTQVNETNHLAMVNKGRGGALSVITDAAAAMKEKARVVASGLWWAVKRRTLVRDEFEGSDPASQSTGFRSGLEQLMHGRASLNDEEIRNRVEQLRLLLVDLPNNDERSLLMRYMDDLKLMKEMGEAPVRDAIDLACSLFDKLDKHAMGEARLALGDSASEEGDMRSLAELLGGKRKRGVKDGMGCADCNYTGMKDGAVCPSCGGKGADVSSEEAAGLPSNESPAKGSGEIKTTPSAAPSSASETPKETPSETPTPPNKGPESGSKGNATDEPDPAPPPNVPGSQAMQTPSPSPEGVPAQPVGEGPSPAAPAAPGAAAGAAAPQVDPVHAWAGKIAALLDEFNSTVRQHLRTGAPGDAPAAPAAPAQGPAPAQPEHEKVPGGEKPTPPSKGEKEAPPSGGEKGGPAPAGGAKGEAPAPAEPKGAADAAPKVSKVSDAASSLTALLSSGKAADAAATEGLDGILNSNHTRGRK